MRVSGSVVMKFGGTSVCDAAAIERLCDIVRREPRSPLVVVSALAGVTDQLVTLGEIARLGESPSLSRVVGEIRTRHVDLAAELLSTAELVSAAERRDSLVLALDRTCEELRALVSAVAVLRELSPRSVDAIVACGETMSSRLVAAALAAAGLAARWVDAAGVLVTDDSHGRAQPDTEATAAHVKAQVAPHVESGTIVVVGGFLGATPQGVVTTLGRGGSDYSAAIFGAALGVDEIQIWTDVDGMLTADPGIVSDAHLVPALTFAEASELAYFGAKVLHPATIQPAIASDIPVRIVNSRRADAAGTRITAHSTRESSPVAALASKRGLTVIEIASARMLMAHGFLKRLFEVFDRLETAVDVVTTSEVNVSVTIDDPGRLDQLVAELSRFAEVSTEPDMALLCVVGERLHDDPMLFPQVVSALGGIGCRMVSQSASRRNLTFVMRETELPLAMTRLHDHFFARLNA